MASCWSFQMERGALRARFTVVITMGSLIPEALKRTSNIRASPWLVVEV